MSEHLTETEFKMIEGLPAAEIELIFADYSLESSEAWKTSPPTRDEFTRFLNDHRRLGAAYSRKLLVQVLNARRTFSFLPTGHRLKDAIGKELEALDRQHASTCLSHHQQRECLLAMVLAGPSTENPHV